MTSAGIHELYLKAASVPDLPGVYAIGPYGRRVSFASQQQRAFNTVWALRRARLLQEGLEVAVIGGGLAGLTAAVALTAHKSLIWIYEAHSRLFATPAPASHRYVHPSVNFWPDVPPRPTTAFPFFDWFAASATIVVDTIRQDWRLHFESLMSGIYLSTKVTKIELGTNGKVHVYADGPGVHRREYDIVLLTTGFGPEKAVVGAVSPSYWVDTGPDLEGRCPPDLIVSGSGDGGLIDALRSIHRFFDRGRLVVRLVAALDQTAVRAQIESLEKRVAEAHRLDEDAASLEFERGYNEIVSKTPPFALDILDTSLLSNNPPRLIGRLPAPFSFASTPAHKFMLAHALSRGALAYVCGDLNDGPMLNPKGGAPESIDPLKCVVRHGATPPIEALLSAAQVEALQLNQQPIADLLISIPNHASEDLKVPNYLKRDYSSKEFVESRWPLAMQLGALEFGQNIGLRKSRKKYAFTIKSPQAPRPPGTYIPDSLFGITLDQVDTETVLG